MSYGFWLWLDKKIYVNQEHGNNTALFLESEFGKVITQGVEVWLRGGGNVAGELGREERQGWKAEVGIRFFLHRPCTSRVYRKKIKLSRPQRPFFRRTIEKYEPASLLINIS